LATATTGLSSKLDAAGHAAQQFVEAGKLVSEKSAALSDTYVKVTADMEKVVEGTKAYETQVSAISSQLTSLNAVYEMQLKALQAQSEKIAGASAQVENLAAGMKSMLDTTNEALEGHKAYAAGAKQLAGQLADLNKVYGNMLNALS
jgi:gliding motility-associated protein GldL